MSTTIQGKEALMRVRRGSSVIIAVVASSWLGVSAADSSVASPLARTAGCSRNVTGSWRQTQSNFPAGATFQLRQSGTEVTGSATIAPDAAASLGYSKGKLTGTIKANHIDLVVRWEKSTIDGVRNLGHYFGTVTAHRMGGGANNLARSPEVMETWSARGSAPCR
jgi:hypothetical protein